MTTEQLEAIKEWVKDERDKRMYMYERYGHDEDKAASFAFDKVLTVLNNEKPPEREED